MLSVTEPRWPREVVQAVYTLRAVAAGEQPGQGFVFVFDPASSTVKRTAIRGEGMKDDRVFITDGLEAGDVIAVAGVSFLRDGQQVKLMRQ